MGQNLPERLSLGEPWGQDVVEDVYGEEQEDNPEYSVVLPVAEDPVPPEGLLAGLRIAGQAGDPGRDDLPVLVEGTAELLPEHFLLPPGLGPVG